MAIQSKRKSMKKASVKKGGKSHSRTQKKKGGFMGVRGKDACPKPPPPTSGNISDLKMHMICKIGKARTGRKEKLDDLDDLQKMWLLEGKEDQFKKIYAEALHTVINDPDPNTQKLDKSLLIKKLQQLQSKKDTQESQPEEPISEEPISEEPKPEEPKPEEPKPEEPKPEEPKPEDNEDNEDNEDCNNDIKNLNDEINPCENMVDKNKMKRTFLIKSRKVHPDKNPSCKKSATAAFQKLQDFCMPEEDDEEDEEAKAKEEEEYVEKEKKEKEASKREEEINNKMEKIKNCEKKHTKNGILNDEGFQTCVECDSDDDCDDEPSKGGKKRSSKKRSKKNSKKGSRKSKK